MPSQRYAPLRLPTLYSYINPTRTRGIMVKSTIQLTSKFSKPCSAVKPLTCGFWFQLSFEHFSVICMIDKSTDHAMRSCSLSPGYRLQLLHSYIGLKNERATPFLPMQRRFRGPVYFFIDFLANFEYQISFTGQSLIIGYFHFTFIH